MRIMGLDLGDKRIGVALSDSLGWTAQGMEVIPHPGAQKAAVEKVLELAQQYEAERIVVGLPVNMNGSHGGRAEKAKRFARQLAAGADLPVDLWDERLTTMEAEKLLLKADVSRSKRRKVIDKMAAVLILQGYLDNRSRSACREDE